MVVSLGGLVVSRGWFLVLFVVGLFLFQHGYFSCRTTLQTRAIPTRPFAPHNYRRVLLFIVDALRLDFVTENPSCFPNLHALLRSNASQSLLFNFRADPPTVTSQRLKALTTGTVPTFIDFTGNFNSDRVVEDSWVEQLAVRYPDRERAFFGDDTWASLFPASSGVFSPNLTFPFDSFNTRDLYTVDDGIEKHLFPYLAASRDWSLVVAHFLGVDHVGHTYSARHPLMHKRLARMDYLLGRLIANETLLPQDALLLFFGDHGMTEDGNHGGATHQETDAALFAYSRVSNFPPAGVAWDGDQCDCFSPSSAPLTPRLVSQVDIVPTLSLLLGLPIPFSNIGRLVPEFFFSRAEVLPKLNNENADQISRYFKAIDASFSSPFFGDGSGLAFLRRARDLSSIKWASENLPLLFASAALVVGACIGVARFELESRTLSLLRPEDMFAVVLGLVHASSALSNSCVIEEHWLCLFIAESLLLVMALSRRDNIVVTSGARFGVISIFIPRLFLSPYPVLLGGNYFVVTAAAAAAAVVITFTASVTPFHRLLRLAIVAGVLSSRWKIAGQLFTITLNRVVVALSVLDVVFSSTGISSGRKRSLCGSLTFQVATLLSLVTPDSVFDTPLMAGFLLFGFFLPVLFDYQGSMPSPFFRCVLASVLGRLLFFSCGHKLDFGTLHLSSGFTLSENFQFYIAGLCLAINTLGADTISYLCMLMCHSKTRAQGVSLVYRMAVVAGATMCVLIHRRHLMVWTIFAPKLIFEMAFLVEHMSVTLIYFVFLHRPWP